MSVGWSKKTRIRANKDHARKKRSREQRQHLEAIKSPAELRSIVLGSRHIEVKKPTNQLL